MQLTQLQRTANQREAGQSSWVELCRYIVESTLASEVWVRTVPANTAENDAVVVS